MAKTLGSEMNIGIASEFAAGTPKTPTAYPTWLDFSMQAISEKGTFKGVRGIRNMISNSFIKRKYGQGSLSVIADPDTAPYFFKGALGSWSSATASGESVVYDHTITVQNTGASLPTSTLVCEQGGVETARFANAMCNSLNFEVSDEYAKITAEYISQFPDTTTLSESYTQHTQFAYNQYNAYFGTSLSAATGTAASGTLTTTGVFANNETVTVGPVTYTMVTALSNGGNTPYEVLIGAAATNSLDNLRSAVNGLSGAGTTYGAGTLQHPSVKATTKTASTLLFVALATGTGGNSIATTETGVNCSFGGAVLASGAGAVATPLKGFTLNIKNNVQLDEAFLSGSNGIASGGLVAGRLEASGSYTLHFSDMVELNKYRLNTKHAMIVQFLGAALGTVPTLEQITIKIGRLVLSKPPLEYKADGLIILKQEFDVEYDATDKEVSAVITNGTVGTTYAPTS